MSNETWLAEFYPIAADSEELKREDAAAHSLKKWEGALTENLARHGLDSPPIHFTGETCAMCQKSFRHVLDFVPNCEICPVAIQRGRDLGLTAPVSCDNDYNESWDIFAIDGPRTNKEKREFDEAPYTAWEEWHDPLPMIGLLQRCQNVPWGEIKEEE